MTPNGGSTGASASPIHAAGRCGHAGISIRRRLMDPTRMKITMGMALMGLLLAAQAAQAASSLAL